MLYVGIGVLAILWACGDESLGYFTRIFLGFIGTIVMIGSIKLYNLGKSPKLEEEY
jgi:uncharacterized membrane protein YeaQ/YmgE (transglycosylase-associated protein family)